MAHYHKLLAIVKAAIMMKKIRPLDEMELYCFAISEECCQFSGFSWFIMCLFLWMQRIRFIHIESIEYRFVLAIHWTEFTFPNLSLLATKNLFLVNGAYFWYTRWIFFIVLRPMQDRTTTHIIFSSYYRDLTVLCGNIIAVKNTKVDDSFNNYVHILIRTYSERHEVHAICICRLRF